MIMRNTFINDYKNIYIFNRHGYWLMRTFPKCLNIGQLILYTDISLRKGYNKLLESLPLYQCSIDPFAARKPPSPSEADP